MERSRNAVIVLVALVLAAGMRWHSGWDAWTGNKGLRMLGLLLTVAGLFAGLHLWRVAFATVDDCEVVAKPRWSGRWWTTLCVLVYAITTLQCYFGWNHVDDEEALLVTLGFVGPSLIDRYRKRQRIW